MKLKTLSAFIPIVMLPLGAYLGYQAFHQYSWEDIERAVSQLPRQRIALAFLFSACSYLCLTGFDAMAMRYIGKSVAYPKVALTSFTSLSIGHNVGVAALSSGTIRYRFYSGFGLDAAEVGKVILFCGTTVGLGLITLGGIALLVRPAIAGELIGIGTGSAIGAGIGCLALSAAYVVLACRIRRPLRLRGHELGLPKPKLAVLQILIGTVNFAFVAAVLHQLLAGAVDYPQTLAIYVLSSVATFISHVPGGLGVIEYVVATSVPQSDVVGALIGFRIVYFLVPLILGGTLLAGSEIVRWRTRESSSTA